MSMVNLIPENPGTTPNYWCTWGLQNYIFGQGDPKFDIAELEGTRGAIHARNNLNQVQLLGWAGDIYDEIRQDLYLILDDGWDLPLMPIPKPRNKTKSTASDTLEAAKLALKMKGNLSSFYLHNDRFPGIKGEPKERLKQLNDKIKQKGWKGIGVWIAAQEASNFMIKGDFRKKKYWKERIEWCKFAGIQYWKVDWGIKSWSRPFRKMLTELGKNRFPTLLVEHANPRSPFNSKTTSGLISEKFVRTAKKMLKFCDVYRIYDVSPFLSVPTTLDRVTQLLVQAKESGRGKQLIHCEDELYIAAALGCVMGIMRHPYKNLRMVDGVDIDFGMTTPRMCKNRIDEAIRAIKWQRIAPAFASSAMPTCISNEYLFDEWHFQQGQFWDTSVTNKTIKQGAPAIVARGLKLPEVHTNGIKPYILASQNPSGTVSIASIGRTGTRSGYTNPKADVTLSIDNNGEIFGIFGYFRSITLNNPIINSSSEIWAQDIKGKVATDIATRVDLEEGTLRISGDIITELGLQDATPGDISEPGMAIRIKN